MTMFEKACRRGAGDQGISLSEATIRGLVAVVARDLEIEELLGCDPFEGRSYFEIPVDAVAVDCDISALGSFERLLDTGPTDTDMFFFALAALHRARLKFANIVAFQAIPTLEQVGPRGLLQCGNLDSKSLGALLILRKWMFDIDNRAAQETGYLFEPIIAGAIGGAPVSARNSPVTRNGTGVGRQVDCLRGNRAYEVKIRVTIAASSQGRWKEELAFPKDCEASGFVPVLVVFDGTANQKLDELQAAFLKHGGEVFVGDEAWTHLQQEAGNAMGLFIARYIRNPLAQLLSDAPTELPELRLTLRADSVHITVGQETLTVERVDGMAAPRHDLSPDVADVLPGTDL